jgi:hypothetical protein
MTPSRGHYVNHLSSPESKIILRFLAEDIGKSLDFVLDAVLSALATRNQPAYRRRMPLVTIASEQPGQ